ncbi:MAG TPA: hypothetical protein DCE41_12675 [Cytophagales bacterium]|nr:hypothetical protein [Cytophagales bacterium]HAA17741.1 hypothetical protein [Cytophagales bacterium]
MKIDVVFSPGEPRTEQIRERLHTALKALRADLMWREWQPQQKDGPAWVRRAKKTTIFVNGRPLLLTCTTQDWAWCVALRELGHQPFPLRYRLQYGNL